MKRMMWCAMITGITFGLSVAQVQATGEQFSASIHISGTITTTGKSTFDDQGALSTVDFGDVRYNALHTLEKSYKIPLTSGMNGSGNIAAHTRMKLISLDNSSVHYHGKTLLPVKEAKAGGQSANLAIQLWVNGVVQDLNEDFIVDMTRMPTLEAELIQTGPGNRFLHDSPFRASATLMLHFL
ncbi:hypothetical protein ACGVWS_03990 [Enterobacteriaceae bacterium LUAb1]